MTDEPQLDPAEMTDEQMEAYLKELEEYAAPSVEERAAQLQAEFIAQEAHREARANTERRVRNLKRAFKGIHSGPQIRGMAVVGLLRLKKIQDENMERPEQ